MSHPNISTTIVKLFAIGLFVFAFQNAGSALFFITSDTDFGVPAWVDLYLVVSAIAIPAIAAATLWARPSIVIGAKADARASEAERALDAPGALKVGLGLIGVYFMAFALGSILEWLLVHIARKQTRSEYDILDINHYYPLYSEVLWLLIGLALFLGASGITKAFYTVRSFGLTTDDRPSSAPDDGG
jgi:hypothetical protein